MSKVYIKKKILMMGACIFAALFCSLITTKASCEETNGELNAFYPAYATFSDQIKEYIDDADTISFAWCKIDSSDSILNTEMGKNNNYGFYYPVNYVEPVKYAKSKEKTILLSIYMDGNNAIELLPYVSKRASIIKAITEKLNTDITQGENIYFDGIVIDFEGLKDTGSDKKKILYNGHSISYYHTKFLKEIRKELDKYDKKLYVAVNPRLYYNGYDYKNILKIADRVIIMAHDYEPVAKLTKAQVRQYFDYDILKPIDSLAPVHRIREALNDLQSAASDPSLMSKVLLQIAFDTAQWQFDVKNASGWNTLKDTSLSKAGRVAPLYQTLKARIDNNDGFAQKLTYGYNNELQSPCLQFYNSSSKTWNIIIYENSTSISAKIDLAKTYGVGGISVWALHNVPDYTDENGLKYKLDVWSTIINKINDFHKPVKNSTKIVSFSDASVENAVRNKLGKTKGDISLYDVKSIYRLKLDNGVKTLKDLKNFTNLEYLDAQGLGIKDISAIGKLTGLRVLYLQNNKISDIKPLEKLTSLQKLDVSYNNITSITPLKNLTNLTELYLKENKIKDYSPVKKLYNKKGFKCDFVIW